MPGSSVKQWRAFLSVTAGEDGLAVNAIDRIGEGPWYDRLGRMVAPTREDLVSAPRLTGVKHLSGLATIVSPVLLMVFVPLR